MTRLLTFQTLPENFLEFGPDLDSSTQYNDILGDDSGYVATLSSSINVFDYDVEKLFVSTGLLQGIWLYNTLENYFHPGLLKKKR